MGMCEFSPTILIDVTNSTQSCREDHLTEACDGIFI